jgi:molybdopterin synthase sulfur carrier subunit
MIRVILPTHLQRLAGTGREVRLQVAGEITQRSVIDALEASYPTLRGTIRDQLSLKRRPFIRFFACGQDISLDSPDELLPAGIRAGTEVFMIVGAMAGG